jgi:hypothetical protein
VGHRRGKVSRELEKVMNTVVYYVVSASCATGTCPQAVAAPVQPAPVVIYQAAPRPALPWLAPRPPVFMIVR